MSFTRIRHWPIRDRPAFDDTHRPLFWTLAPCSFRNAIDGPSTDYLLVRGPRDIFRGHPQGPQWRLLDQEREWWLYERELGEEWGQAGDRPDMGPCAKDPDDGRPWASDPKALTPPEIQPGPDHARRPTMVLSFVAPHEGRS